MKNEWFKDWFASEEYLDVYNHRNSSDAEKIINLILTTIPIKEGAKILDAACGTGRHSIILAKKGFNITAFDLSKTLLNIGKSKSKELELNINFINADIRKIILDVRFYLIVNLFTSFGYFESDEENFSFVHNAFSMLEDNGWYVLDFFNKAYVEKNIVSHSQRIVNNKIIKESRKIISGRVIKDIQIIDGENQLNFVESVRLYSPDYIIKSFERIGFKAEKILGSYLGEKFNKEESKRLIIFFRK